MRTEGRISTGRTFHSPCLVRLGPHTVPADLTYRCIATVPVGPSTCFHSDQVALLFQSLPH